MKSLVGVVVFAVLACTGAQYDNHRCPNLDLATAIFPKGEFPESCRNTADCPTGRLCCPVRNSDSDLCLCPENCGEPFPGNSDRRCPHFNLAAATFPVGGSPSPCVTNEDCSNDKLCCTAIGSFSKLCLISRQCPPPLNLAVVRFLPGLPLSCYDDTNCPKDQLCCSAINPTSKICRPIKSALHH